MEVYDIHSVESSNLIEQRHCNQFRVERSAGSSPTDLVDSAGNKR